MRGCVPEDNDPNICQFGQVMRWYLAHGMYTTPFFQFAGTGLLECTRVIRHPTPTPRLAACCSPGIFSTNRPHPTGTWALCQDCMLHYWTDLATFGFCCYYFDVINYHRILFSVLVSTPFSSSHFLFSAIILIK